MVLQHHEQQYQYSLSELFINNALTNDYQRGISNSSGVSICDKK